MISYLFLFSILPQYKIAHVQDFFLFFIITNRTQHNCIPLFSNTMYEHITHADAFKIIEGL